MAITRSELRAYAQDLVGLNKEELKTALYELMTPSVVFSYGSGVGATWEGFYYTDRNADNTCVDRYSNQMFYFPKRGLAITGMNIEHSFPKSWWGGDQNNAYKDLFNLMPSESSINQSKSNRAMGVVTSVTTDNGCTKVGKGVGKDGASILLWEPADKWKGDFSRGYLYMATAHQNLNEKYTGDGLSCLEQNAYPTFMKWASDLYLQWSRADKVSQMEVDRNNIVEVIQNNRNLFVDYPYLAEYIWGDSINIAFNPETSVTTCEGDNRYGTYTNYDTSKIVFYAGEPVFSIEGGTKENPAEVANTTVLKIEGSASTSIIYYRIDGGQWQEKKYTTGMNGDKEYHNKPTLSFTLDKDMHIEAYCTMEGRENSETLDYYYKSVDYSENYLLYEQFDGLSGSIATNSSTQWQGNANFPTVSTAYQAGTAVRLGKSGDTGYITSKTLDVKDGKVEVEIGVKGWTTVEGKLDVTVGEETQTITYKATISNDFEPHKLTFSNVPANATITIATTAKRAFIDYVTVKEVNSSTAITALKEQKTKGTKKYNLSGQEVGRGYRGIVISNGKKILCR